MCQLSKVGGISRGGRGGGSIDSEVEKKPADGRKSRKSALQTAGAKKSWETRTKVTLG